MLDRFALLNHASRLPSTYIELRDYGRLRILCECKIGVYFCSPCPVRRFFLVSAKFLRE